MKNIQIIRNSTIGDATEGVLLIDGIQCAVTLEDIDRGLDSRMDIGTIKAIKIQDETAIPVGTYNVVLSFSPHFNCILPELIDVPGYENVRIHFGNYPKDTDGCVLVGQKVASSDVIEGSRIALESILNVLKDDTDITITISRKEV